MRNRLVKAGIFALVMAMMLAGCGAQEALEAPQQEAASVVEAKSVIFVADGKEITLEDTEGKTLQQLLDQARIQLKDGDMLALSPEQMVDDTLTIQVLHVTGTLTASESASQTQEPAEPETTAPETQPADGERTVVSVEVYNDCDDSGHGVKVITYSDGTQEEEYF